MLANFSAAIANLTTQMNVSGTLLNAMLPVMQGNETINWFNFTIDGGTYNPLEESKVSYDVRFEHEHGVSQELAQELVQAWIDGNFEKVRTQLNELVADPDRKLPTLIPSKTLARIQAIYNDQTKKLDMRFYDLMELHGQLHSKQTKQGEPLSRKYPYMVSVLMSYAYDLSYQHEQLPGKPLKLKFYYDLAASTKRLIHTMHILTNHELAKMGYCKAVLERNNFFSDNPEHYPENRPVEITGRLDFTLENDAITNLLGNLKIEGDGLEILTETPNPNPSQRSKRQL